MNMSRKIQIEVDAIAPGYQPKPCRRPKVLKSFEFSENLPLYKCKHSLACRPCGFCTRDPRTYFYHLRSKHLDFCFVHTCNECFYASRKEEKLIKHSEKVHGLAPEEKRRVPFGNRPQKRQYDGEEHEGATKKLKEAGDERVVARPIKRKLFEPECWWRNDITSAFSEDGTKQRKVDDEERVGASQYGRNPNAIGLADERQPNGGAPDPNDGAVPRDSQKRKVECLESDAAGSTEMPGLHDLYECLAELKGVISRR